MQHLRFAVNGILALLGACSECPDCKATSPSIIMLMPLTLHSRMSCRDGDDYDDYDNNCNDCDNYDDDKKEHHRPP